MSKENAVKGKVETKKVTTVPEEKVVTKKVAAKKAPVKKAMVKEVAKKEEKVVATNVEKATLSKKVEKEVVKKVVKAPAKKAEVKKTEAKKEVKKVAEKKKTVKKAPVKKVVAKKDSVTSTKKVTVNFYEDKDIDTCMDMMKSLGVSYEYNDYCHILLNDESLKNIEKKVISEFKLKDKKVTIEKDGYDLDVIEATFVKIAATMDLTAAQFKEIKKNMDACMKIKVGNDVDENSKNYFNEFKVAEKVLMVAQRKNIKTTDEATSLLKSDVKKFVEHLFVSAYEALRTWKYEDVEFYQEFAFALLSQLEDLYDEYQNKIQMDCADLFILHGDENRGDNEYLYVLSDNEIKDYIYYRFANIYVNINLDKAKDIAYKSFQFVDDRYDYHSKIVEIINQ